jgi:hypothetical protein
MKNLEERFWEKVDKSSSDIFYNGTRCWEWIGAINSKGYGHIGVDRKTITAHRISWILTFGEVSNLPNAKAHGTCILHHCDNRICVRPDHLFLGTNFDNVQDRTQKGRSNRPDLRGEKNARSILTEKDVIEIRQISFNLPRGSKMKKINEIASSYRCSVGAIRHVLSGDSWKGLKDNEQEKEDHD